jgi:hypothetical protein
VQRGMAWINLAQNWNRLCGSGNKPFFSLTS